MYSMSEMKEYHEAINPINEEWIRRYLKLMDVTKIYRQIIDDNLDISCISNYPDIPQIGDK